MADLKISAMPTASSVADGDLWPLVQGGANKKAITSVIKAYMKTAFDLVYHPLLGFTPENVANKSTSGSLGTSDLLYPSQKAVKTYADTKQTALGFTPENVANKSTTTTLGTSDTLYPSQKAVKTYVDAAVISAGAGDVVGPSSAVADDFAQFNGATGKLIKDGGLARDTDVTLGANSDSKIPSQKAVRSYVTGYAQPLSVNLPKTGPGFTVDGGGAVISSGKVKGFFTCPFAATITGWNIVVDTGTVTIKVWKIATGTAHPTGANSINTGGIALSTGTAIHSNDVTDFTTTTVTANDIFAFDIVAVSGVMEISFNLELTKV